MSDHVVGIADKITSKEAGKNHNLIYSVCVVEEGQDDTWFGYGWDEPEFTEGAEIEFDIEYNGDFMNIDVSSLNILQDGEPKRSSRGRSSGGGGRNSRGSSSSSRGSSSRSKPAGRGKPAAKRGGASSGGDTDKDKMWADKDKMIRRQACMNTAIKLVTLLHSIGVLPKPAKKSEGYDATVALCDEEASRLYDQYEEQVYGGGSPKQSNTRGRGNYSDDIPD